MSYKNERWHSNAIDITMDCIDRQLYRNNIVNEFIDHKSFIVAEKGMGKTLLLKKKKKDLLKKNGLFIPENPELDFPVGFESLSSNQISFLESHKNTKRLWQLAIQLSAIKKYYHTETGLTELDKEYLPIEYHNILTLKELVTPSDFFTHIIYNFSISEIENHFNPRNSLKIKKPYSNINSPVYIFIDRLDQALLNVYSQNMWIAMQTGLLEAGWDLNEYNRHVKIYCSIRKEAFFQFDSEIKGNLSGKVCLLTYNESELHELVNTLSKYYESGKTIEEIVGTNTFTSPLTGNEETVFTYILRHTVSRPRDLIRIASHLCDEFRRESNDYNIKRLREAVNEKAQQITKEIFIEQARFLDCLQTEEDRKRFLSLIPKNVLNQKVVDKICKIFNKKNDECTKEQCKKDEEDGGCKHPFCELYNIGLLGYARKTEPKQKFKNIDDDGNVKHLTGNYPYYFIHPSLYEIIKPLHVSSGDGRYILIPGITTGNGLPWTDRETQISKIMDDILDANLPLNRQNNLIEILEDGIKNRTEIDQLKEQIDKNMGAAMRKIFLSYRRTDKSIVDNIDEALQRPEFKITRDERDLDHKKNITEFVGTLQQHDFIVTVISDSYLKSKNCLLEIDKLMKMRDYKRKTLQIILADARIFDTFGIQEYINYWQNEKDKLQDILNIKLTPENIDLINEDIKVHDEIITNLLKFLSFIKKERGFLYEDLFKENFITLTEYIQRNK